MTCVGVVTTMKCWAPNMSSINSSTTRKTTFRDRKFNH